ncbi:pancreatic lipase-related protein 2-like isoform X2 [Actinia tenebrosa]|nr:pancreatic lipase-related protein 2-like isoform X2 [Actinia tenebrosa]
MFTGILVYLSILFASCSADRGICYPKYGCFHNDAPFKRPLVPFPNPADLIGTKYRLYTRASPLKSSIIDDTDDAKLLKSGYDGQKRTILIVHGFVEHGQIPWMNRIRQALLQKEDANVIQVDWYKGAKIPYETATANTRMVGAQIFELINFLNNRTDNTPSSFYIVGFSLGAHIAGYVGRRIKDSGSIKLGRITGLDPASVFFVEEHRDVRLDPTDADFVDVMHTDIDFLGSYTQSGHVDFYPNGGLDQRGCPTGLKNGPIDYIICDHMRAPEYYHQSVLAVGSRCPMRAFPCKSMYDFERGYCFKCQSEECPTMGYGAEAARGKALGKHYLYTNEKSPFCSLHYQVAFKTGHGWFAGISAAIHINIYGSNGNSGIIRLKTRDINDGTVEAFIAPVSQDLGVLTKVDVRHNGIPIIQKWYLEKVVIKFEGSNIAYTACFNAWLNSAGGVRKLKQGELPC